jgi:YggT family protein
MLLADAVTTAQNFVTVLYYVYLLCIIAYILTSWVPLPYNVWLNRVQRFLYDVVDPYLRLFRRVLPQLSVAGLGLDLSPIVAIIVLSLVYGVVVRLIGLAGSQRKSAGRGEEGELDVHDACRNSAREPRSKAARLRPHGHR